MGFEKAAGNSREFTRAGVGAGGKLAVVGRFSAAKTTKASRAPVSQQAGPARHELIENLGITNLGPTEQPLRLQPSNRIVEPQQV